jgi:hypothetical protein
MSPAVAEQDVQRGPLRVAVDVRKIKVPVLIEIGGGHVVRIYCCRQQPRILKGLSVTACDCEAQTENETRGMRAQSSDP